MNGYIIRIKYTFFHEARALLNRCSTQSRAILSWFPIFWLPTQLPHTADSVEIELIQQLLNNHPCLELDSEQTGSIILSPKKLFCIIYPLCFSKDYRQTFFSHVSTFSKLRFTSHDVFVWPWSCFILSGGLTLSFISTIILPFTSVLSFIEISLSFI